MACMFVITGCAESLANQEAEMSQNEPRRGFRFSIREMLLLMLLIAALLGWNNSSKDAAKRLRDVQRQIMHSRMAADYDKSREETMARKAPSVWKKHLHPSFSYLTIDGVDLGGVSIDGGDNSFQSAALTNCDLSGAALDGLFQGARFDGSNLTDSKLGGGGASFQMSSFANANLTRATLRGGGSSFQGSSFAGANLTDAIIICSGASFQAVKLDGAIFVGADLSRLDHGSLESCYFQTPPTYDERTRFPTDFDPVEAGWKLAE